MGHSLSGGQRILSLLGFVVASLMLMGGTASAYPGDAGPWSCDDCHATTGEGTPWDGSGPHSDYTASTKKCALCHSVHRSPADSVLLLPGPTITDSCETCHDGTGGIGVYATITAFGGVVGAEHSCEVTSSVPGGSTTLLGVMGCGSCHSVHGANTVEPFLRDSASAFDPAEPVISSCLLRDNPAGSAPGSFPEYGARWCASCHDQRHSDYAMSGNHPVETSAAWGYGDVTSTVLPTSLSYNSDITPVAIGLGRTNGGYLMSPVPATGDGRVEVRRDPLCQQCHEDSRNVGDPFQGDYTHRGITDPGDPWYNPFLPAPVNPEFLTFPHQTTNTNLLVETDDGLCMNCHDIATLP